MKAHRADGLSAFFEPASVAVFGSLNDSAFAIGNAFGVIKNMLSFRFKGKIYPINLSGGETMGIKAYTNVSEVGDAVDLAMLLIPPRAVPAVINQCASKGIRAVIVGTENFAEAGEEGAALQKEVVKIARRSGTRVLGPNTLGVLNPSNGLITTPYPLYYDSVMKGGISYCSQSGLLSFGACPLKDKGYPISKMCDFGNKCDVNEVDLLNYLAEDSDTRVISMHLEDIKDGHAFMEATRKAVVKKPVLIFKPGRSEAGAKAAASHTGSLAGDNQIYDSAFRQAGAIRVNNLGEFWEIPRVFSSQPLPKGNRFAVIVGSGGSGVIAIDTATDVGLIPATFTTSTVRKMARLSPRLANNPVDIGPVSVTASDPFSVFEEMIPIVLADGNVDCVTIGCMGTPESVDVFRRLKTHLSDISKPITIFLWGTDLQIMEESARQLEALGIPTYLDLETAVKSLGVSVAYSKIKLRAER